MYKVPVILKDDYVVFFEPSTAGVLIHCDVKTRWTKTVKKNLQEDWSTLRSLHSHRPMYALHKPEQGDKHIRFLQMMGFKLLREYDGFELWTIGG